jgi:hypothetical protein
VWRYTGFDSIFLSYKLPVSFTTICSIFNAFSVYSHVCRMSGNCCALLDLRVHVVVVVAAAFLFPLNLVVEVVFVSVVIQREVMAVLTTFTKYRHWHTCRGR